MRVEWATPVQPEDGCMVIAATGVKGSGSWRGASWPSGSTVDVELSVVPEIDWAHIMFDAQAELSDPGPGRMQFVGQIKDIDEMGVVTLELRGGGVVLLDSVGEPPIGSVGREVSVIVDEVEIFPSDF